MTSLSGLFESVGAPLINKMWSWGAHRFDGSVVLRVWQDETSTIGDKRFVRLINNAAYADHQRNLGYAERRRHLDAIRAGSAGYVIFIRALDPASRPKTIASFDTKDAFLLGELVQLDGDDWGEISSRVLLKDLARERIRRE